MALDIQMSPFRSTRIVCVDSLARLDQAAAIALAAMHVAAAGRYVNLHRGDDGFAATRAELEEVTPHLGVWLTQEARTGGWSEETGRQDGQIAAANALAIGYPRNAVLECDLEGTFSSDSQYVDYASGWYEMAMREGAIELAAYIGAGVPLDASALYHHLRFHRYRRSLSQVPNVMLRGYQMIQLYPDDVELLPGRKFDLNVVQSDYLAGRWIWAVQTQNGAPKDAPPAA
jgi:hypothetical protein